MSASEGQSRRVNGVSAVFLSSPGRKHAETGWARRKTAFFVRNAYAPAEAGGASGRTPGEGGPAGANPGESRAWAGNAGKRRRPAATP